MEIVSLKQARAPSGLAKHLRELAEQADDGRLTEAVIAYVSDDSYGFSYSASLSSCLVLSSLLHHNCIDRMSR